MRKKVVAGLLALFFGIFGLHKLYTRRYLAGILYAISAPLIAIIYGLSQGTLDIMPEIVGSFELRAIGTVQGLLIAPLPAYLPVIVISTIDAIGFFFRSQPSFDKKYNKQDIQSKKTMINLGISVLIIAGSLFLLDKYIFSIPVVDIKTSDAAFKLTSEELYDFFDEDEETARAKYLHKVLSVKGPVEEIGMENLSEYIIGLRGGDYVVECKFLPEEQAKVARFEVGDTVNLKCVCRDYTIRVKLEDCLVLQ